MYRHFLRGPVRAPSLPAPLHLQRSECDQSECKQFRRMLLLCQIKKSKGSLRMGPIVGVDNRTNIVDILRMMLGLLQNLSHLGPRRSL